MGTSLSHNISFITMKNTFHFFLAIDILLSNNVLDSSTGQEKNTYISISLNTIITVLHL